MLLVVLQAVMLLQALRQDAGTAKPMRTRQWKRVLPAEEYHRRAQEDTSAVSEYVIRPEYEVGTEPENDTHQPRTWHWQREQEGRPVFQLALTGGASAGKRTAAHAFEELGAAMLDSVQMWQELLEPGTQTRAEVDRIFGEQLPTGPGAGAADTMEALDELMAGNDTVRARAHELLLPHMRESARRRAREAGPDRVVVQVLRDPLETEQRDRFDLVVAVAAPAEERVQRLRRDEGVPADVAWEIVDQAPSDDETREVADRVIVNDDGVERVREQVREIWEDAVRPVLDEDEPKEAADDDDTVRTPGTH